MNLKDILVSKFLSKINKTYREVHLNLNYTRPSYSDNAWMEDFS
jgi:hypothetical protein